jgi:peptide/nickel transport system substrate-binding protein
MSASNRMDDLILSRRLSRRALLVRATQAAVLGGAAGLLAACGGDDDTPTATSAAAAPTATPAQAEAPTATPAAAATPAAPGAATPTPGAAAATPTAASITLTATPIPDVGTGDVREGGTLTYGTLGNVDYGSLDMTTTTGTYDLEIGTSLNDAYIWLAGDGSFVPGLAESWEASADGLSFTFKLREDVVFHDGTPLNAEAAKFNFDRMTSRETNPSGLSYSYLGAGTSYQGCEVLDDYTFQINLSSPNAIFMFRMRRKYISPQSPTAVQAHGTEYFRNPVGCGPMKLVEWVEADHVTLERFEEYTWGPSDIFENTGPTHLDRLVHRIFADLSTKAIALESGELDYAARLNEEDMVRFDEDPDLFVVIRNQMGQATVLDMNTERPPTNDIAVRQAISWAIDREGLVHAVFFGLLEPATNLFTPDMWSYDASLSDLMGYDPDRANQILEDAGWVMQGDVRVKDGQELRLTWLLSQAASPVGQFVQADLAKVGIAVDLQILAGAGLVEAVLRGDHNIAGGIGGWVQEDPDVTRSWLHSSLIDVRQNGVRVRDPELDDLLNRGIAFAGDPRSPEREEIYKQIQREVMENAYVVPIYYRRGFEAGHPWVKFEQFGFVDFDPYGSYHEWLDVWLDR